MLTIKCGATISVSSGPSRQVAISKELAEFVAETAVFLQRRGLADISLLLLNAGTPLAFMGGQLIWVTQPLLSLAIPTNTLTQAAHLLEQPTALAALRSQLQTKE